jgi:hypothetical protein
MSRQTALDNISLRPCGRWAHTEYSLEYHKAWLAERTGLAQDDPGLIGRAYVLFEFDFLWLTNDGLIDWAANGRTTDMGHATYAVDGSDRREPAKSPFNSVEEVWAFDAVEEYGLPEFDEQVRASEKIVTDARRVRPDQLVPGGYYRTIVSGAIAAFGWDMLLLAASDPVKMEKVLDGFFRRTLFHMEAWAETSAEVIIQHDDFVWMAGPFMHPDFYRKVIIPRYARLWKPLREAGKKVLFCSDGDYTVFVHDLAEAGADGYIFEPCVDFGYMVENFGDSKCLVGSFMDCRALTLGHWEKVKNDIDRTFDQLAHCRGAIIAVGNHLPPNIPEEMLDRYFGYLLPRLER